MIERLLEQMHWANEAMIAFLVDGGRTEPDLLHIAAHILNAETIWLKRIRGEPWSKEEAVRPIPAADMGGRNRRNREEFLEVLRGDLDRVTPYHLFDGTPGESAVRDILLHVVTHGFHHRGQIAGKASALGLKFPNVAYIHWARTA